MKKKYSIRIPLYTSTIKHLRALNQLEDISIILYGGFPDSPFNGGRFNSALNGLFIRDRFLLNMTKKQLEQAVASFYETLTKANQNNISFYLAFSNMFVDREELSEENLLPVQRLVESAEKYGVKNGLILTNQLLENFIRQKYGDRLLYSSSCTKYVSPHKILTPRETLNMYLEDSGKYDYICVTPQDSRRESLLKAVIRDSKSEIIAISNSSCSNNCNSYHHYKDVSIKNKRSIVTVGTKELVGDALAFMLPRVTTCASLRYMFCKLDIKKIAEMQLRAGIVNFKLGRNAKVSAATIDLLVSLIQQAKNSSP